jgi:hypothetical protein
MHKVKLNKHTYPDVDFLNGNNNPLHERLWQEMNYFYPSSEQPLYQTLLVGNGSSL